MNALGVLAACGGSGDDDVVLADAALGADSGAAADGAPASPDAASSDAVTDDFERSALGPSWAIRFPNPDTAGQVQIIDSSDLGMGPGPQGFFLVNWTGTAFAADQYCEATIPADVTADWAHQVYVRWRASDRARYGFGYNNDPGQPDFGNWYFKYDGVPGAQTRVFATQLAGEDIPGPGDVLRVEIRGYELRGYLNGSVVLTATDDDASKIAAGEPGLAARWATGNQPTAEAAKVWESWAGGSL